MNRRASPTSQLIERRAAIVQSNYIPWKGYFDLIAAVDHFVLYDDVQYTRRDWRNRNLIKTPTGLRWLTIPVESKGNYLQPIRDVRVDDPNWGRRHWDILRQNYRQAPCFAFARDLLEPLYRGPTPAFLCEINRRFIDAACAAMGIDTAISWSMDYTLADGQTARLVDLCRQVGATRYLSGPAARDYLDPGLFAAVGIAVDYADYSGYPPYPQLHGPFEHGVSIVDLLFCTGPEARRYLKTPPGLNLSRPVT